MRSVFALIIFSVAAFAADVSGKWSAEFDTQIGQQKYVYEFRVDGAKLTGKAKGGVAERPTESEIKEGKVNGEQITFVELFKFEDNEIRIEYTGRVSGDTINFTRKVADFATEEFVAKRVK